MSSSSSEQVEEAECSTKSVTVELDTEKPEAGESRAAEKAGTEDEARVKADGDDFLPLERGFPPEVALARRGFLRSGASSGSESGSEEAS